MKKTVQILFSLILIIQVLGCASAKKAVSLNPATKQSERIVIPELPKKLSVQKENDSLDKIYPLVLKERYNIALLLPLYLYKDELNKTEKNAALISQDFYKGILLGLDSLKKCGADLNIYVIESDRNFEGRQRLKDTLKKLDIDLVIGPFVESELKKIVPFCNANKINLVTPVATLDTCFDKTYYIESNPGSQTYGRQVASLVKKNFSDCRVFLINERTTEKNPIAKEFVNQKIGDSLHIINYKGQGAITFTGLKGFSEKNVIFIPSKNEIFISAVISQLQLQDTFGYETTIIGLYPWLHFKSLEGSVWEQYHLHLALPFHIDYTNAEVKSFVQTFRTKYNEEPNEYSFRGFDDIVYYASMLKKYGKYFQRGFANESETLLHENYSFERLDNCSGYRNTGIHIYKFEDYEFRIIIQ